MSKQGLHQQIITFFDDVVETFADAHEKNPRAVKDLVTNVSFLVGSIALRRKLKKLGFSKREQYVIFITLPTLWGIRASLKDIQDELRKLNDSKPKFLPSGE